MLNVPDKGWLILQMQEVSQRNTQNLQAICPLVSALTSW